MAGAMGQDLRYAVRLLVKDRWFTAVAAGALALGIGANAAVFTFVNAVLLRGLPFDDPGRIVAIGSLDQRGIGIRMALGAQPRQVRWLVLRRSLLQLAIGVPIGTAGAFGVGRLLQSLLVQTSARDPLTIASIALVMIAVSVAACVWPARKAARLDPVIALRYE